MGLGIWDGSNPGPGSRTTMSMPRAWSQATQHWICLDGSLPLPCSTALASASRSASSISNSRPAAQPIWVTILITRSTIGEIALTSAASVMSACTRSSRLSNSQRVVAGLVIRLLGGTLRFYPGVSPENPELRGEIEKVSTPE